MGDEEEYLHEGSEEGDEESSGRQFLYILGGLGGLLLCTALAFAGLFYVTRSNQAAQNNANATVIAYNLTVTYEWAMASRPPDTPAPTNTPAPTDTPKPPPPTPVVVTPTASPTATDTPGPATPAPSATSTRKASPTVKATATRKPITTASASGLADTGIGGMELIVLAAGLVVVLFIARRLRTSQS